MNRIVTWSMAGATIVGRVVGYACSQTLVRQARSRFFKSSSEGVSYMVQSVSRTFDILEALANATEEVSLTELQTELRLPLSTIHRLLDALVERGYAAQNAGTRYYGPGPKLLEVAQHAKGNQRFQLRQIVRPYLHQLTKATGETSNLVVPIEKEIVYVDQVASPRRVRLFTEVGQRAPMYCTGSGKAILSLLHADQLDDYCATTEMRPLTPRTLTDASSFKQELAQARQRGFTVDNEEFDVGVRCIAAAVQDASGACVAAISVSGPSARVGLEHAYELGPLVKQCTALCSMELGYRAAPSETTA